MNVPLGLDTFVDIVEQGSIAAAARRLGETRSTLSRRLSALEEELGVQLLVRSTRALVVTRAGEELYQRAKRIVAEVRAAEEAIRRLDDVPRGPLRVSIPPGSGDRMNLLGQLFATFLHRYPEVQLEIVATDRHVDLVREGFDVAIRAGEGADPNLLRRMLARISVSAVCSRSYADRYGVPVDLEGLAAHRCLVGFGGTDRALSHWPLRAGGTVRVSAGVACNDLSTAYALVAAGHGIGLLPEPFLEEGRASGALLDVLPDVLGTTTSFSVVYPERRFREPVVRAFVDFIVAHLPAGFPGAVRFA